jgi:hypothetical protein
MASNKRYYGQCDSFFMVSDEDEAYTVAGRNRETARAIARQQHRKLAGELSRVTADEYQEEILDHMEDMEVWQSSWLRFRLNANKRRL